MAYPYAANGHVPQGRPVGGLRKISIALDPETFGQVRHRAAAADHSFSEEARTLIEWGLEAADAA